jgi:NAD(P)-dependent dehydrogenase (short-subunit alcohol dehydrogenase family)
MIDFAGRTAFVTGGANGVGIGLVRALLAEGCKVAMADIREDHIERALKSLDNQMVMGVKVDVSSREDMARAADKVEARFGPVSLLFNNAGVNLFQTIEDSSWSDWDWLMGVNLHGPINGVMTFVPRMIAAGNGGYVVNTASMAGWLASGSPGIYNTTKFAVRGMSESLRYSRLLRMPRAGQELHLCLRRCPPGRTDGRRKAGQSRQQRAAGGRARRRHGTRRDRRADPAGHARQPGLHLPDARPP